MLLSRTLAVAATAAVMLSAAHAQAPHGNHSKHGQAAPKVTASATPATKSAGDNASTKAFKTANDKMHADMDVTFTGDADKDFLAGMIPHHQGAIDMAKIVLEHGKDPKVKKLARDIIKAQEREIAMMKSWLAAKKK